MFKYKHVTLNEAVQKGFIGGLYLSVECQQDRAFRDVVLRSARTPEITDNEIASWQDVYSKTKDLDIDKVKEKYKVEFVRDEWEQKPYTEPEGGFWVSDDPILADIARNII